MTKFYYYNIWIEDEAGNRLSPRDVLSDEIFPEDLYEIAENDGKNYSCQFDFVRSHEYYGVLVRTKDDSGFVRLREDGRIVSLSDATDDEGGTGDITFDYVDFGICLKRSNIDVLVEVGFQTPGIGMITEYLSQHVEYEKEYSIEYETRFSTPPEEKIERLLDSELKKVDVSFKKNPKTYGGDDVEETLQSLIPDDYRLEFGISLERGETEKWNVGEYMEKMTSMLGMGNDTVEDSISKIDFPRVMNSFTIVGLEGDEEVETNLADDVMKEEIDTSRYGVYDSDLGEILCKNLRHIKE